MSLVTVRRPADVLDTLSELEIDFDIARVLLSVKRGNECARRFRLNIE